MRQEMINAQIANLTAQAETAIEHDDYDIADPYEELYWFNEITQAGFKDDHLRIDLQDQIRRTMTELRDVDERIKHYPESIKNQSAMDYEMLTYQRKAALRELFYLLVARTGVYIDT